MSYLNEVEPPRLVCLNCNKAGKYIFPYPHSNRVENLICPYCNYDNLEDIDNLCNRRELSYTAEEELYINSFN